MSVLINTEKFIKPKTDKVIFFLCPYATPINKLDWAIKGLKRAGFSVIAYEYPRSIFRTGEPGRLFTAIAETRRHIQKTVAELEQAGYIEFGFVASSLGSFVIFNCLASIPQLKWGILNTGGDVTEGVWSFESERIYFESKGFTKRDLEKAWRNLQYPVLGDLRNKRYILITSKGDKTAGLKGALECFDLIKAAGPDIQLIMHKKLGHKATLVRNLIRIRKLVKKVQHI